MSSFQQQPSFQSQPMNKPVVPGTSSGKATTSLVLGILSFCLSIITGLPAIIVGAMALGDIKKSHGAVGGKGAAITGIILGVVGTLGSIPAICIMTALLLPAVQAAREAASGVAAQNDLKVIGLALHDYHDTHKRMPVGGDLAADLSAEPKGQGLSWRVHILPYVGEIALFEQFDLSEPWDGPTNRPLLDRMPDIFASPRSGGSNKTSYVALRPGPGCPPNMRTLIMPDSGTTFGQVNDGLANTVMVIDAGPSNAVEWTKPDDFEVNWNSPKSGLDFGPLGLSVVLGDGSVFQLSPTMSDEDVKAAFFANDGIPTFLY